MTRALLLIGHGSHLDANSSRPVFENARRLRATGAFDEVRAAFWKEEPSLARALDGCAASEVTIVPLFMSTGYFTEQVIPREMGLDGAVTVRGGQTVRYTPPVGAHPALARVIVARALEAGATAGDAIAVLGHGTPRNPNSERTIYEQTERVRATGRFAEVTTVFMDQEPAMGGVFERVAAETVVMVPLFIAEGWHVGQTIPEELDIHGPSAREDGRRLIYARPVGTHPCLSDVVFELASEAARW